MDLSKVLKGVKVACDKCDWRQEVEPVDMKLFLNVECPECGDNLITQEELDMFEMHCEIIQAIPDELGNMLLEAAGDGEPVEVRVSLGRD